MACERINNNLHKLGEQEVFHADILLRHLNQPVHFSHPLHRLPSVSIPINCLALPAVSCNHDTLVSTATTLPYLGHLALSVSYSAPVGLRVATIK